MKISEIINVLMAEQTFKRTPKGRPITELAFENINAAISDKPNYEQKAMLCRNCGFTNSSLLFSSGCPNCNSKDLTTEFNKNEIM